MSNDDDELVRPGVAAKRLGITTHTLADWADSGIITPLVTPGGHRRYYAADVDQLLQVPSAHRPPLGRLARNNGAASQLGRPLTDVEVAELAGAPSLEAWAQLAATYQADGSSIRQIASATGMKRATVAARIRGSRAGVNPRAISGESISSGVKPGRAEPFIPYSFTASYIRQS